MKQKLMALAIAGAFAAPAVALAQNSSVQIYGTLKAEYGFVSMPSVSAGAGYNSWDGLNSGASNMGFKGEEKLGGGMSAWFQCESDLRFLSGAARTSGSLCDRNSAIGLKGGFGNVFVGTWDSPDKLAVGKTRMSEDTGWLGTTHALFNESNRVANSVNYHSNSFGGLSFAAQLSSTNAASNTLSNVTTDRKGRHSSFNVIYGKGPLDLMLGYTKQDDAAASLGTVNAARTNAEDKNLSLGGAYAMGKFKLGVTYTKSEVSSSGTAAAQLNDLERTSWNLAGTYDLPGAGSIRASYTKAGDTKGTAAGVAGSGVASGAKQYTIDYQHAMSKRTSLGIGYARVKNDTNGTYTVGNTAATVGTNSTGFKSSVVSLFMFHKF